MANDLVQALSDLQEEEAIKIAKDRLGNGDNPVDVLNDARKAMEIVGDRFSKSEYFIPDLIYSGEILSQISEIIKPYLSGDGQAKQGEKFILGTVAGDIHDIGLNIVDFMLSVNGFEVYNLGVDIPAQQFVEKIKETGAKVVGLSGFLTIAFDSMKETIKAIEDAGLRDDVKIMIGGGQIDEDVKKYTGADAYGRDAMAAVAIAKEWTGVK